MCLLDDPFRIMYYLILSLVIILTLKLIVYSIHIFIPMISVIFLQLILVQYIFVTISLSLPVLVGSVRIFLFDSRWLGYVFFKLILCYLCFN